MEPNNLEKICGVLNDLNFVYTDDDGDQIKGHIVSYIVGGRVLVQKEGSIYMELMSLNDMMSWKFHDMLLNI